jgi:hypothetical protein
MSYDQPGAPPPPQGWQPPQAGAPYPASSYGYPSAGYGYSAPAQQTKPLKGMSTALVILLAVAALASVIAAFALFNRASVVDGVNFSNPSFSDIRDISDADDQVGGAISFFFLALVVTGIMWVIWQFRHAKNANALRGSTGLGAGWAIGGWFVPLGNLVLPQLQLLQSSKASDPDLPQGQPASTGTAPSAVLLWWALYDLAVVVLGVANATQPSRAIDDPDKFVSAERIFGVGMLCYVAAAIVAIVMVRAVTERQTRAIAALGGGSQPQYQQPYAPQQYAPPAYPQQAAPPPPTAYPAPPSYPQQPAPPPPTAYPPPPPPQPAAPPPPPQQWPPPSPPPPT